MSPSALTKKLTEEEKEKELMARVGMDNLQLVKGCSGTHDYALNKRIAGQLLRHFDWVCEIQQKMAPDYFAEKRMPDAEADAAAEAAERPDGPYAWPQFCRGFCRTVADGTVWQHLELLFHS